MRIELGLKKKLITKKKEKKENKKICVEILERFLIDLSLFLSISSIYIPLI